MLDKDMPIEDLFNAAFNDDSINPSEGMWDNIEGKLNEQSVDNIYREQFKNDEVKPPAGIWIAIQTKLFLQQFLSFEPARFNVYYVAAALFAGIGIAFVAGDESKQELIPSSAVERTDVEKNKEEVVVDVDNAGAEQIATFDDNEKNNDALHNKAAIILPSKEEISSKSKNLVAVPDNATNPGIKQEREPKVSIPVAVPPLNVEKYLIEGKDNSCKGSDCVYRLQGISSETVKWNIPSNASIIAQSSTELHLQWEDSGETSVEAEISNSESVVKKSLKVKVDKPVKPSFRGKTDVCQGDFESPYSSTNDRDLGKQYVWKVRNNPYTVIGNGFIKVDWKNVGYDTITLTDINMQNQCVSSIDVPVFIHKIPEGEIISDKIETCEYRFEFSAYERGNKYKWTIEDEVYTDEYPVHFFDQIGEQTIKLTVTSRNKCKSVFTAKLHNRLHDLVVPKDFKQGEGNVYTSIVTTPLLSYHMEIFNARNERVWETTKLVDGYPAEGWTGATAKGEAFPAGKYVCRISATFEDGTEWEGFENSDNKREFTLYR